jgi:hypothetical protein
MAGGADIGKHGVDDFIGGGQQRHGVVARRAESRSARSDFADAVITGFDFVADIKVKVRQVSFDETLIKTVHLVRTLCTRRAEPRLADKQVGDGAEDGEKEEDDQPGKRGADVFLFVQHAQDAAERGAGVGENEDFCPGDVF